MRALLWLVLAAAGVWGGYWWVGSASVEAGVTAWFEQQAQAGRVAQNDGVVVRGFPNRFDLTVEGMSLSDPATGLGWQAPFVQVFSMSWKPWHLIAALSPGQVIVLPDQSLTIDGLGMKGSLQLHPNAGLGLYESRVEATDVSVASDRGWRVAAARIFGSTLEMGRTAHRLGLSVQGLTPDATFLARLTDSDLPGVIETLHLDATAQFTAPLDRLAQQTQPRLTEVTLADARLIWGAMQITATGGLKAGPDGLAAGEIAVKVVGWRRLPGVIGALGVINPQMEPSMTRALEVMAQAGADPQVLQFVLTCADGQMSLGPFPLGPAPRLN
jgi:hypothetical protein